MAHVLKSKFSGINIVPLYRRSIFQIDWLLAIWIFQSFIGGRKVDNKLRQLICSDLFFDDAVEW